LTLLLSMLFKSIFLTVASFSTSEQMLISEGSKSKSGGCSTTVLSWEASYELRVALAMYPLRIESTDSKLFRVSCF